MYDPFLAPESSLRTTQVVGRIHTLPGLPKTTRCARRPHSTPVRTVEPNPQGFPLRSPEPSTTTPTPVRRPPPRLARRPEGRVQTSTKTTICLESQFGSEVVRVLGVRTPGEGHLGDLGSIPVRKDFYGEVRHPTSLGGWSGALHTSCRRVSPVPSRRARTDHTRDATETHHADTRADGDFYSKFLLTSVTVSCLQSEGTLPT